ncbi:MAG TPA: hypothetical protein VMS64_10605 [Candidatus Methylomirabilis sp.]|nr:hypothetical protein [Candidatus Methylomirabilis sp.]
MRCATCDYPRGGVSKGRSAQQRQRLGRRDRLAEEHPGGPEEGNEYAARLARPTKVLSQVTQHSSAMPRS